MTIFDAIRQSHDLLRDLLCDLATVRSPTRRGELLHDLRQSLQLQLQIAERVLYSRLAQITELAPVVTAAVGAYAELSEVLRFLERAASAKDFPAKLDGFTIALDGRLAHDEAHLFVQAKTAIPPVIAELLGDEWCDLRTAAIERDYMSCSTLRMDAGYYA